MRTLLAATALALSMAAGPAGPYAMTPAQQNALQGWPADKKTKYDAWPGTYQEYFWALTPGQQDAWWILTDEQRGQIYAMTPEQRTTAWTSIESQIAAQRGGAKPGATPATPATPPQTQANPPSTEPASPTPPNPATAASEVPPAMPAAPGYKAGPYKGAATAAPAEAMNKTYPVCTRKVKDNCRNPGGK